MDSANIYSLSPFFSTIIGAIPVTLPGVCWCYMYALSSCVLFILFIRLQVVDFCGLFDSSMLRFIQSLLWYLGIWNLSIVNLQNVNAWSLSSHPMSRIPGCLLCIYEICWPTGVGTCPNSPWPMILIYPLFTTELCVNPHKYHTIMWFVRFSLWISLFFTEKRVSYHKTVEGRH